MLLVVLGMRQLMAAPTARNVKLGFTSQLLLKMLAFIAAVDIIPIL